MRTEEYLAYARSECPELQPKWSLLDSVGYVIHSFPTTVKTMEIAGIILGCAMVAAYPLTALGVTVTLGMQIGGLVIAVISTLFYFALDLAVPPTHDMKNHAFTPSTCEGGRLYYRGDIPILSLDADDPFLAGKAQGYLLGGEINRLTKRIDFCMHTLLGEPRAENIPHVMQQIKNQIPHEYLVEMQGLVEGFRKWSEENPLSFPKSLTIDDLVLIHLMPDFVHFNMLSAERRSTPRRDSSLGAAACSAIIDYDMNQGITFARNMDWPSFGMAGAYSLVIHRRYRTRGFSTVEVGIPGLIGTLTGMNAHGLSLAMNVCNGDTRNVQGMPAAFFNRLCLERCRTVADVEAFTRSHTTLGPYHLSVADPHEARAFHLMQGDRRERQTIMRRWDGMNPLITLNHYYYSPQQAGLSLSHSNEREEHLHTFFRKAQEMAPSSQREKEKLLTHSLSLPFVNNWETTHSVIMQPALRKMRVSFNNAFAANGPYHELPLDELF